MIEPGIRLGDHCFACAAGFAEWTWHAESFDRLACVVVKCGDDRLCDAARFVCPDEFELHVVCAALAGVGEFRALLVTVGMKNAP